MNDLVVNKTSVSQDDINGAVASTINMVMRNKDKLNVDAIQEQA